MSPTIRNKYKYFPSTVQRAKDRRQNFIFAVCRLTYDDVTSNLISLAQTRVFIISPSFLLDIVDLNQSAPNSYYP